ncbi:MAG TPA: tetratricopeptide repeat protein [Bryobacteraceae bacterium]|nr:tetratricopeptide repeat protein [Bryobacteraceae bacterium]
MKALLNMARPLYVSVPLLLGLLLGGCGKSWYLASYERDISSATGAIETARDDAHRAAAYTKRGDAYSEKARYSRAFKLISPEEYARQFGLAIKDHDQAIALDPASAEAYYRRGQAYYDRAVLEVVVNGTLVGSKSDCKFWFDPAIADFKKAIERDARHDRAWDMLGLTHETMGELDQAISEYTQEMALNPLGKSRLADAYCERGGSNQKEKKYDAAMADYEKSIENGANADGCSCDPYNPLLGLYAEDRRYDQGWEVVHKALKSGKWIAPEWLARLQKESGRRN